MTLSHQTDETEQKLEDITSAVVEELNELCQCDIGSDNIDGAFFHCFEPSSFYVTYRARLTSIPDSDSHTLVSYLEDWVSGGPTIPVQSILMTIDSDCLVAINGFGEGECVETSSAETSTFHSSTSTDNTAAIIGGTVVVVLIIAVLIFALALLWSCRHGKLSLYKSEE